MAEFYNAGTDIINAYLAGLKVREAREARIQQGEQAKELAEIRKQQIKDAYEKSTRELDLRAASDLSTANYQKAQIENMKANMALRIFNGIHKGDLSSIADNPEAVQAFFDRAGIAQFKNLKIPTQEDINKQTYAESYNKASGIDDATKGTKLELANANNAGRIAVALSNQQAKAAESELNRRANKENTIIRANAMMANKNASANERKQSIQDAIDSHRDDILTGQTALEDIPKGNAGLAIQNAIKSEKGRIFTRKERDKFDEAPNLATFIDNVSELRNAVNNYDLTKARGLSNSLQADLGLFARNTKAEKGNMSNQDIARIADLLPGWTYSKAENNRRVKAIEDIYFTKMEQILRGTNPIQRKMIKDRWSIRERPTKLSPEGNEMEMVK